MSGVRLGAADRNKSCWQRRKRRQATSHQLFRHLSWEQIPSGNNVSCFTSASQILIKSFPGQLLPDILQWRGYRKHNSQLDQVGNRTTQHDSIWEVEGCCQWGEFRVRSYLYLKCWYFVHHGIFCINFNFLNSPLNYYLSYQVFLAPSQILSQRYLTSFTPISALSPDDLGFGC